MTLPTLKLFPPAKMYPKSRPLINNRPHRLALLLLLLLLLLHRETPIPHGHQQQLHSRTCLHLVKKKVSESHLAMVGVA
jgi:hypothetical protein